MEGAVERERRVRSHSASRPANEVINGNSCAVPKTRPTKSIIDSLEPNRRASERASERRSNCASGVTKRGSSSG